jgi:hypothetical protein
MAPKEFRCNTPKSASHLFNNLSANGKLVGYASYTTAVLVPDDAVKKGNANMTNAVMLESEDAAQIQQIRWVQLQAHELLVLATTKNLNIYSSDGKRLIHVVTAAGGDSACLPLSRRRRRRRRTWSPRRRDASSSAHPSSRSANRSARSLASSARQVPTLRPRPSAG